MITLSIVIAAAVGCLAGLAGDRAWLRRRGGPWQEGYAAGWEGATLVSELEAVPDSYRIGITRGYLRGWAARAKDLPVEVSEPKPKRAAEGGAA